jgi:DNA repair exonuclease SbcCD ATPase subunit
LVKDKTQYPLQGVERREPHMAMEYDPQKIEKLSWHLSEMDTISRDLMLTVKFQEMELKFQEMEIEKLKAENEQLKASLESASADEEQQRAEVFHHLADSIRKLTWLRWDADKEDKANERRPGPKKVWVAYEKFEEKYEELQEYLLQSGNHFYPHNLCVKFSDDPDHNCYVLLWD